MSIGIHGSLDVMQVELLGGATIGLFIYSFFGQIQDTRDPLWGPRTMRRSTHVQVIIALFL